MSTPWRLERGAVPTEDGNGIRFQVWAPAAREVGVRVERGARVGDHPLARGSGDVWEGVVPGLAPGAEYRFVLDRDKVVPDPVSRHQPEGPHGPSRVVDPRNFHWTDAGWRGLPLEDYVLYELHVGTFTEAGTFDAAVEQLPALKALGVTAIEIMPVAQFPGARNWGYDGVLLYAPQASYGGPDGLRHFVNAAHEHGLAVVLDVVYNHIGPEGNYLDAFGPYFTETYRTPWGRAVNYDGPGSDEVRRYVIENALYWITEYHLDGLRLDAIHGIYDFGAEHVLAELTRAVQAQARALGRQVVLIAESDLNDPRVVRPQAQHGYGFDAHWADDFHHAVHSALTGETGGYYADFAEAGLVAHALRDPYVYAGRHSPHRRRRHGGSSAGLSRAAFVVCVQNHDQVGNRAAGERLSTLVCHDRQRLAAALLLLSPYVPMLWMGEEYGETNPFQYFVDHGDPELLEAVRQGRRREFEAFGWGDEVPDPGDEATFHRSRLDRAKLEDPRHAGIHALYRDLLALRKREPALRPGSAQLRVDADPQAGWLALALTPDESSIFPGTGTRGRPLYAVFNLSDREREAPTAAAPRNGARWVPLITTHDARYAAGQAKGASRAAAHAAMGTERIALAPHEAILYGMEHD